MNAETPDNTESLIKAIINSESLDEDTIDQLNNLSDEDFNKLVNSLPDQLKARIEELLKQGRYPSLGEQITEERSDPQPRPWRRYFGTLVEQAIASIES